MTTAQTDGPADLDTDEQPQEDQGTTEEQRVRSRRRIKWKRLLAYIVLPALAMGLALGAGYLKWRVATLRESHVAGIEAMRAASDSAIALLSYKPETVQQDLEAARSRLTGQFSDTYTSLTRDVVIPGARQKHIAATATVPAATPLSSSTAHAEVLLFVDQTITIGNDAPTKTTSSVRVTLEKIDNRWLISQFDPV
ncbi:hypothetical protein [Mycolicibacterium fortuitum]|uniref:hypothetical protein n=1 Tax=Mycolicibacterium fortuitum TaxID=1766 RepID=UPI00148F5DB9|nr:hypothetical protein [Mycolicibacterium fortuitum]